MLNMVLSVARAVSHDLIDIPMEPPTPNPLIDPEPPSPVGEQLPVYLAVGIAVVAAAMLVFVIARIRKNRRNA